MENMIKSLNELGINVTNTITNNEEFMLVCRTKNDNMIVVAHQLVDEFEDAGMLYTLDVYNANTLNCFGEAEQLLEAVKNYIK